MRRKERLPCPICGKLIQRLGQATCSKHCSMISRWDLIHGDYHEFMQKKITSKIHIEKNGCWSWLGNKSDRGYAEISFKSKKERCNRVSYRVFRGEIPDKMFVCHKCDNPECVNPSHLFLGTHQQNVDDKVKKNRQPNGSRIKRSKLSEKDIVEIRRMRNEKNMSQREIGEIFGVVQTAISSILLGKTWSHV